MTQFIPRDNVYVYFRINDSKTVMVILNNSGESRSLDATRFDECLHGARQGKNVVTGENISLGGLEIKGKTAIILEFN